MKKILYIGSLLTKNDKNDGERIKTELIFRSLKKHFDVAAITLTDHRLLNSLKFFFKLLFGKRRYDFLIISKDPHGANILHKIVKASGFPFEKTYYFEIGSYLYDGVIDGTFKKKTFDKDKLIVVETNTMKTELESLGFNNVEVYPNFKPMYDVPFNEISYPKQTLNLVFFSRVDKLKGVYNLIDSVAKVNSDSVKFRLDIYGKLQSSDDFIKINDATSKYGFVRYMGTMNIEGCENYIELSNYDLHVFPSFFYAEGFPGSIIDFFFAGVPTLSSSFTNSKDIFTENDSYIFDINDKDDLCAKLLYIYEHQNELPEKRKNTFLRRSEYSVEEFEKYIIGKFNS